MIDPTSNAQTRVNEQTSEKVVQFIHRAKHDFLIPFVKGQRVLDTGCGAGYGLQLLADYYKSAVGLDGYEQGIIDAQSREIQNTTFKKTALDDFELEEKNFDVVISVDLIQQLENPQVYLNSVHKHLSKEGTFIVITPNLEKLLNSNPCHFREYTVITLKEELSEYFNVIDIQGLNKNDRSERLQMLWRLDPLKIRNLLPEAITNMGRRLLGIPPYSELSTAHYPIGKNLSEAYSLIAICKQKDTPEESI